MEYLMYNDVCNEWFKISFKDIYSAIGVSYWPSLEIGMLKYHLSELLNVYSMILC